MSSEHLERRLTAILAADVVGSSRLMGADEEGTLAQLKDLRKLLVDPKIAEHRGRIVKNTGDGALVEFGRRKCRPIVSMPAVPRSADIRRVRRYVSNVPQAMRWSISDRSGN